MITTLSFYISLAETAEDKSLIERLYNGYERYMYAVAFSGFITNRTQRIRYMRRFCAS